ncbi:hypothetical protein AU194_21010 [Mycobacterium sp. GA-2829]|nr:hypothetical protein AU194_21010 [Mycobacterium sp. GA-2829]
MHALMGGAAQTPPAAPASALCGTVRLPATDAMHPMYVVAGDVGCDEAGSVVNRYLMDPGLERAGNTQAAEFLGWLCVSPTAVSAEVSGYAISCSRDDDEIQVK